MSIKAGTSPVVVQLPEETVVDTPLPSFQQDDAKIISSETVSLDVSQDNSDPAEIEPQEAKINLNTQKKMAKEETISNIESQKMNRLKFLLERSSVYSNFLSEKLDVLQKEKKKALKTIKHEPTSASATPRKRARISKKGPTSTKENEIPAGQPKLVTGAILKDFQVDGVQWLISLYENGLNGILADEMGLGKTIQTISFLAHLVEHGVEGPFLIVVPLSTINNWMNEFAKFSPTISTFMLYGTKEERMTYHKRHYSGKVPDFMVTITSYEIAMKDRPLLQRFAWKYLVVDEGHRLKNFDCKLSRELKKIGALNRLLLTGTPLHNNLSELWALLNFILPDIFDDVDSFIDWFDLSDIGTSQTEEGRPNAEQKNSMVSQLHHILKPFLLRRLKSDVITDLPKKREYILNAYLTEDQKELYNIILEDRLRDHIVAKELENIQKEGPRPSTFRTRYKYINDGEDIEEIIEEVPFNPMLLASRNIGGQRLQKKVMQLRKVCNHPLVFNPPYDMETGEYIYDPKEILSKSGKMLLLDKLLHSLMGKGHRVLIFSQFTQVIDIIETYLFDIGQWEFCRIDGTVTQDSRQHQIQDFNNNPNLKIFLISTRAGGLGINLATADTVIFYDSDWNPQMDLQAQDRCHRIGQKKPVIIYRLITANTVESHLIGKANSKRLLEKLVIHKSKFKSLKGQANQDDDFSSEIQKLIFNKDYENVIVKPGDELLNETDLKRIMDRSEEAYIQAEELLSQAKDGAVPEAAGYQLFQTLQTEENQFSLQDDAAIDIKG